MSLDLKVDIGETLEIGDTSMVLDRKVGRDAVFLIDDGTEIEQRLTIKYGSTTDIDGAKVRLKHRLGRKVNVLVDAPREIKVTLHQARREGA